ncbi:MAG TPA: glycosyltransferase [Candidatus Eremiobacteraceae bacterium]|nr:glycosyltransferase [Candidatus Eremiobacteraceae bacterium]
MNASVVVPAYQEEASIGALLDTLREQETRTHAIGEILVFDDGSTDATAEVVRGRAQRDRRIRLLCGSPRVGRADACNALFAQALGDATVKFDADVIPRAGAVDALCDALARGASMSFGVCEPLSRRRSFVARGSAHAARIVRMLQRGPRGADFAVGRILALRGDVARSFAVPGDVTNEDHWLSLKVRAGGGIVALAPDASCRFFAPDTFDDYRRQSNRVREGERQLERIAKLVPMSLGDLMPAIARCAIRDPIGAACWATIYAASLLTTSRERPVDEIPIRSSKGATEENAGARS